MARRLTKTRVGGELYKRPALVEDQIDKVLRLSQSELKSHLLITNRISSGYLRSECLVHLVRKGRRSNDQKLMSTVLPVLLQRCEANLVATVPDGLVPDSENLRQSILEDLTDLFISDGMGEIPDELDIYEIRFNLAFRTLRIDAVRKAERRQNRAIEEINLSPSKDSDMTNPDEDTFARMLDTFKVLPTQERDIYSEQLANEIEKLPCEEQKALILVHILGYKVESVDAKEETAATLCNCSGRTIRNWLASAAKKLSRFQEDL